MILVPLALVVLVVFAYMMVALSVVVVLMCVLLRSLFTLLTLLP